jgi:hypothetical protein
MTWMLTATAGVVDLRFIRDEPVDILDIAHHLSQIVRFNGAACRPYSVAEHSLLVSSILERSGMNREVQLAGLLHDAHEAYIGDVTQPLKEALCIDRHAVFRNVDLAATKHVRRRLGVLDLFRANAVTVKSADLWALSTERTHLMPPGGMPWPVCEQYPPFDWYDFEAHAEMTWKDWRDAFLQRFDELRNPAATTAK